MLGQGDQAGKVQTRPDVTETTSLDNSLGLVLCSQCFPLPCTILQGKLASRSMHVPHFMHLKLDQGFCPGESL